MAGASFQLTAVIRGKDQISEELRRITGSVQRLDASFGTLGARIKTGLQWHVTYNAIRLVERAIHGVINAIPDLIAKGQAYVRVVDDITDSTGMSARQASELAAVQMMLGGSTESLAKAMVQLSKNVRANEDDFKDAGIATRNAKGQYLGVYQVLQNLRNAYSQTGDRATAFGRAYRNLGRGTREVTDLLALNEAQYQALAAAAQRSGLVIDATAARNAETLSRTQAILDASITGIGTQVLGGVAPVLAALVNGISDVIQRNLTNIVRFVVQVVNVVAGFVSGLFGLNLGLINIAGQMGNLGKRSREAGDGLGRFGDSAKDSKSGIDAATSAIERQIDAIDRQLERMDRARQREDARKEQQEILADIRQSRAELEDIRSQTVFAAGMSEAEAILARQALAAQAADAAENLADDQERLEDWRKDQAYKRRRQALEDQRSALQEQLADMQKHSASMASLAATTGIRMSDGFGKGAKKISDAMKKSMRESRAELMALGRDSLEVGKNFAIAFNEAIFGKDVSSNVGSEDTMTSTNAGRSTHIDGLVNHLQRLGEWLGRMGGWLGENSKKLGEVALGLGQLTVAFLAYKALSGVTGLGRSVVSVGGGGGARATGGGGGSGGIRGIPWGPLGIIGAAVTGDTPLTNQPTDWQIPGWLKDFLSPTGRMPSEAPTLADNLARDNIRRPSFSRGGGSRGFTGPSGVDRGAGGTAPTYPAGYDFTTPDGSPGIGMTGTGLSAQMEFLGQHLRRYWGDGSPLLRTSQEQADSIGWLSTYAGETSANTAPILDGLGATITDWASGVVAAVTGSVGVTGVTTVKGSGTGGSMGVTGNVGVNGDVVVTTGGGSVNTRVQNTVPVTGVGGSMGVTGNVGVNGTIPVVGSGGSMGVWGNVGVNGTVPVTGSGGSMGVHGTVSATNPSFSGIGSISNWNAGQLPVQGSVGVNGNVAVVGSGGGMGVWGNVGVTGGSVGVAGNVASWLIGGSAGITGNVTVVGTGNGGKIPVEGADGGIINVPKNIAATITGWTAGVINANVDNRPGTFLGMWPTGGKDLPTDVKNRPGVNVANSPNVGIVNDGNWAQWMLGHTTSIRDYLWDILLEGKRKDYATFATGTDYVPQTGMALIHKGEMVIPAKMSEAIRRNEATLGQPAPAYLAGRNSAGPTTVIVKLDVGATRDLLAGRRTTSTTRAGIGT